MSGSSRAPSTRSLERFNIKKTLSIALSVSVIILLVWHLVTNTSNQPYLGDALMKLANLTAAQLPAKRN